MKYIEEINPGDCFELNGHLYILTTDFKKNNYRLAISLVSGVACWFKSDSIISTHDIYVIDKANNIIPIKSNVKTIS